MATTTPPILSSGKYEELNDPYEPQPTIQQATSQPQPPQQAMYYATGQPQQQTVYYTTDQPQPQQQTIYYTTDQPQPQQQTVYYTTGQPQDPQQTAYYATSPPQPPPTTSTTYTVYSTYPEGAGYGYQANVTRKDASPPSYSDATQWGDGFNEIAVRHAFIRKVYLILLVQLAFTVACICVFIYVDEVKKWVWQNSWFYYVSFVVFIVTYIALMCCPGVRRKFPGNFICLAIFTLALSYMTATISSFYDTNIVLIALGITAAVCFSISVFAWQTRIDFTMCNGLIFALVMVAMFFGIACLFARPNGILYCVYGALIALVFSLFLAYDTQQLLGGKNFELSPEEYIFGSLQLYLDIVYIFIIILACCGRR